MTGTIGRWPLLVLALAFAMPTAHAAPGVEVCDLPPRFGVEATAATIVRAACQEHRAWFKPFIDTHGRLASLTVTEAERARLLDDMPAWQRVARYWRESGTLSAMAGTAGANSCQVHGSAREVDNDCRAYLVDNPWSAAFVSWVMSRSSVPGFRASPRHVDYIAHAWRDPEASPYAFADPFTGKAAPGDLLCFLRDGDDGLGPEGLRQALGSKRKMPRRSHCDIVVAANVGGDRTLYLIGGNVLNSVVMRMLPLDASGRLLANAIAVAGSAATAELAPVPAAGPSAQGDTTGEAAALEMEEDGPVAAGATCRPGDPAACSFNRRDWVVLLKLKPQAQLGGAIPAAATAD